MYSKNVDSVWNFYHGGDDVYMWKSIWVNVNRWIVLKDGNKLLDISFMLNYQKNTSSWHEQFKIASSPI